MCCVVFPKQPRAPLNLEVSDDAAVQIATQKTGVMHGVRFSIIFSVNEVYQQLWASLFQTQ